MSKSALAHLATDTGSTKRKPPVVSGKSGDPVYNLQDFPCFPVAPASNTDELRNTYGLNNVSSLYDTVVDGDLDIVEEKDIFVDKNLREYTIRLALPVPFVRGESWRRLVMERTKR